MQQGGLVLQLLDKWGWQLLITWRQLLLLLWLLWPLDSLRRGEGLARRSRLLLHLGLRPLSFPGLDSALC